MFGNLLVDGVFNYGYIGIGYDGIVVNIWVFYIDGFIFFFNIDWFLLLSFGRIFF